MIPDTILQQGGFQCSRPFYEILIDSINGNASFFDWIACPYSIGGLGLTGVGAFVILGGFIGLKNNSESWTLPITWLAIVTPAMAAGFLLPGGLLRRIAGVLTLTVAMLIIGIYWWWGRA